MALFIASNDLFMYNKNAHGVGIMKENKYQWLFISHWSRDHLVIWVTVTMPYSSYYEYLLVLHVPVRPGCKLWQTIESQAVRKYTLS